MTTYLKFWIAKELVGCGLVIIAGLGFGLLSWALKDRKKPAKRKNG